MRVLVVEDDATLQTLLRDLLQEEGYQPVAARDADQARRLAADGPWHAILADCAGDAYRDVDPVDRAFFADLARHAPVLVTTARAWASSVDAAELGVAAVLRKPYDLDELLAALQHVRTG